MKLSNLKSLYAVVLTAVLVHQQAYGLIGCAEIFKDTYTGSRVMLLGDMHYNDIRSSSQQYEIIEAACAAPSRLILEDAGRNAHQVLGGLSKWANQAGCSYVNIEFRTGGYFDRISAKDWAKKVLTIIREIKQFGGTFKSSYQDFLNEFQPQLHYIVKVANFNEMSALEAIVRVICEDKQMSSECGLTNKSTMIRINQTKAEELIIYFFAKTGLHEALDMLALHQISKCGADKQNAIFAAGAAHTLNVGDILKKHNRFVREGTVTDPAFHQFCIGNVRPAVQYKTYFDPIAIPKFTDPNYIPPFRSKVVLPYMQARAVLEDSAFGRWKFRNQRFLNMFGSRPGFKLAAAGLTAVGCYMGSKLWGGE